MTERMTRGQALERAQKYLRFFEVTQLNDFELADLLLEVQAETERRVAERCIALALEHNGLASYTAKMIEKEFADVVTPEPTVTFVQAAVDEEDA